MQSNFRGKFTFGQKKTKQIWFPRFLKNSVAFFKDNIEAAVIIIKMMMKMIMIMIYFVIVDALLKANEKEGYGRG